MRISDWSSDVCSSDLLVAWPLPHIADVDLHRHLAARADARRRQAGRPKLETGVAEAEAEGEKRRNILEHIAAPGRRLAVVEDRYLPRSEEHTSELQSLMRISYAVFCLKKKNKK